MEIPISDEFRAGWTATTDHLDGVANYPDDAFEHHLRIAWDEFCGTRTPAPNPLDMPAAFIDDWNRMVATVSVFAERYNMRKPDMVFHPEWLISIRASAGQPIAGTLIHMGVRVKFGTWEQVSALKEI